MFLMFMYLYFSVSDPGLWCVGCWCVVTSERVQYPGDVSHHGLQVDRDDHIWAHCWRWGCNHPRFLWLLWNDETGTIRARLCKYRLNTNYPNMNCPKTCKLLTEKKRTLKRQTNT